MKSINVAPKIYYFGDRFCFQCIISLPEQKYKVLLSAAHTVLSFESSRAQGTGQSI